MQDESYMEYRRRDAAAQAWLDELEDISEARGGFEPLGQNHFACFTKGSKTLLVTFENIVTLRSKSETAHPIGFDLVAHNGMSQLTIIADGCTWFRDPAVYAYFDRLVDEEFFEDYDRVIFYGANMGAYGATAYSVAAPGATVIALSPQATLDPRVTEWDDRFTAKRRTNFTDRYGYAPDMIDGADHVYLLYDPEDKLDSMHASLFTRSHVSKLRCRHMGRTLEYPLVRMKILQPLIDLAGKGTLTDMHFYKLLRIRHKFLPYLRNLLTILAEDDRLILSGLLCRNVLTRANAPRFKRRLKVVEEQLGKLGKRLPESKPKKLG